LCPSGIEEFPNATEADLRAAMGEIVAGGLPLLVHAELVDMPSPAADPRSYQAYLASRPRRWEHQAIKLLIALCQEYRCRVHIVHLSSADALPMIREARAAGLPLTVEACPHYLFFAAEEIPDGDPRFKCAPPIRERENRERLWTALLEGSIDTIGSDHSPAPPELKHLAAGDLQQAWGGIASLQLALPAVWTAAQGRAVSLMDLVNWMSRRPAQLVGLEDKKGALATGFDADFVVFDPEAEFMVTAAMLHHRHKITPYAGRNLRGRVVKTVLRGRPVFAGGRFAAAPIGRTILHGNHA
jgi:allantoinase